MENAESPKEEIFQGSEKDIKLKFIQIFQILKLLFRFKFLDILHPPQPQLLKQNLLRKAYLNKKE